jgi:hypothetical protein
VQGKTAERWHELCALAATEQDHEKLLALIREITSILEEKEQRLQPQRPTRQNIELRQVGG